MSVQYLGLGDFLVIASSVLGIEADVLAKATDLGGGDSALNAPAASFGGVQFYPDFEAKVAVLGYRLARSHALPDGNKRTALLAMIEFAERNGRDWRDLEEDDAVETMKRVAAGTMSEEGLVDWVSRQLMPG